MTFTSYMLARGDDGLAHWWRFSGGEELERCCDKVRAVNVTMYRRDVDGDAKGCNACDEARQQQGGTR